MKKNKSVATPRAAAPAPAPAPVAAPPEKSPAAASSGISWKEWLLFWALAVLCFGILRSFFPAPGYVTDTRGYLLGAMDGSRIGYRPMGISAFYAAVYELSPGAVSGVWAQFLLHLGGSSLLLYGISRYGHMRPLFRRFLWAATFLNPALLYLANFLLADSVFISLTFAWAGALLCSLRRANWVWGLAAVGFFYASLYVRYNGLVYPFIAAIVLLLLLGRGRQLFRFSFLGLYVAATALFYYKVTSEMELRTNETVLSGFSGWQTASNAMKAIKYDLAATAPLQTDDPQLRQLDQRARQYIDSFVKASPAYRKSFETDFMWVPESPFKQFEAARRSQYPMQDAFVNWVQTSLILQEYGKAVIRQNPGAYVAHYLLPNMAEFFVPDLEVLGRPQSPESTLWPFLREWYRMPGNPPAANPKNQVVLSEISRVLYTLFSILFVIVAPYALLRTRKASTPEARKLLLFCLLAWLCIAGFDVIAAPQALRYVVVLTPLVMAGVFTGLQIVGEERKNATTVQAVG